MFEGIAEQIADDFFNLVSVEDRIVGICLGCILKDNLFLSEDRDEQFEDTTSVCHDVSFHIFYTGVIGFYGTKLQKLIDKKLKALDVPIDYFHFFSGDCVVPAD